MRKKQIVLIILIMISFYFKAQDSITKQQYQKFIQLKNSKEKIENIAPLIIYLTNNNDVEHANKAISDVEKLVVDSKNMELKKGMVYFSKSIVYKHFEKLDSGIIYSRKAISSFTEEDKYKAEAVSVLVLCHFASGHFDSTITIGNRYMKLLQKIGNETSEIEVLMSVGRAYDYKGNRALGIKTTLSAVEKAKEHKKYTKLIDLYVSLSTIFKEENLTLSKKYGLLALETIEKHGEDINRDVLSTTYLMLGNVYYNYSDMDSARYYYELSKYNSEKNKDRRTYLAALGNLGNVEFDEKNYEKAIEYNTISLNEYLKLKVNTEIAIAYGSLADIYKEMKQYKKAVVLYDSALRYTHILNSADDFIYNYKGISEAYEMMGNHKNAFKYYKLYKAWNDSVNNNQTSKKVHELELDYKYKAEQREKDIVQKEKDLISQEKIKHQKYIIMSGVFAGLCLIVFLGFIIKSNIEKKKTNKQLETFNSEILTQKNIIEIKNNEITDSITYASRIQQGVIPDEEELQKILPQHFVFFKPRDIVSGDFYWAKKVSFKNEPQNRVVIALADCTGHGVPGAFMSMVGNTLLNQTINQPNITNPAQALDYINEQLPKTIKSKSSTGDIKDGMEVAMCDINFDTLTLQFAGANSNIYLVRNGQIKIYKGDKQPIGDSFNNQKILYTNQIIELKNNDCIYMISDGYADQFGGDKGKKFKYKPLEDLFCSISTQEMKAQKEILLQTFIKWKLDLEQVDDVCVIGIRV